MGGTFKNEDEVEIKISHKGKLKEYIINRPVVQNILKENNSEWKSKSKKCVTNENICINTKTVFFAFSSLNSFTKHMRV